jgi:hypothetical protein
MALHGQHMLLPAAEGLGYLRGLILDWEAILVDMVIVDLEFPPEFGLQGSHPQIRFKGDPPRAVVAVAHLFYS